MTGLWTQLRQRKLVQWTLAYVAFAFALLQAVDIVATRFGWPALVEKLVILALCVGLVLTLILAWYHGEQGRQRVSGIELMILAVVLAVGGGFLWQFTRTPTPPTGNVARPVARPAPVHSPPSTAADIAHASTAAIPAKSIAVLPFENLSADKNNAYFADGMQDMILTKLADIGGLRVMSRTATLKYRSHPDDLGHIARQLRVATFLEGSVQKAGNQVLINVQLIDARSGSHLWAQAYKRNLDDIFGVEGEVAQKIAAALNSKLSPAEQRDVAVVPTRNPDAYDAYLRGKHDLDQGEEESNYAARLPSAIESFQRAVKLDPDFALAWAALATSQVRQALHVYDHRQAALREAEANARRALKLAPRLPEAHYAMATVQLFGYNHGQAARQQLQQALKLRPNYVEALRRMADIELFNAGNLVNALKLAKRAFALDPNNVDSVIRLSVSYQELGYFDQARTLARRTLALAPENALAYWVLSYGQMMQTGEVSAALAVLDGAPANVQRRLANSHQHFLLLTRDYPAARHVAAGLPHTSEADRIDRDFARGQVEWEAGNRGAARPYLQQASDGLVKLLARTPDDAGYHQLYARVLAMLGDTQQALQQIHALMKTDSQQGFGPTTPAYYFDLLALARIQALAGDRDAAIGLLQKLVDSRFRFLLFSPTDLRVETTWDPLRKDPRFQALVKHLAELEPIPIPAEAGSV